MHFFDVVRGMKRAKMRCESVRDIRPYVKKKFARKRRQRIDSREFRLTDCAGKRGGGEDRYVLSSEREVFEEAFRVGRLLMNFMDEAWIEVPFLRCVHLKATNGKMISLSSARSKMFMNEEVWKETFTICLMEEYFSLKVNCLNIIHERQVSAGGEAS